MFCIKYFFKRYKLSEVFTPSTIAKLTYVKRTNIETDLIKNIEIPGLQIALFGHSGSGKTTLLMNKLTELKRNNIKTNCTTTTTFDQLIIDAFDKLGAFYHNERSCEHISSISAQTKAKYSMIEQSISLKDSTSSKNSSQRIVPVQLTAERLSEFLGEAECIWVIEDFHKVNDEEKIKLSQVLKVFMDTASNYPLVKIICLGAVGTARELIEYDKELTNRVTESYVPLLSNDEIQKIILKGFNLMNIKTNEKDLIEKIVHYSNNIASVCHQLCYDICYTKDIKETRIKKNFITLKDFEEAVKSYISKFTDTYNGHFEAIKSNKDTKTVLGQLVQLEKENFDGLDILKQRKGVKKIDRDNMLLELCKIKYGEVLRYNTTAKSFSFSNQFFKAFLKMKFALERAEAKNSKGNKSLELYESPNIYVDILNKILTQSMMAKKPLVDFSVSKK